MTSIDPARAQELATAALRHHRALPHMLQREGHAAADALESGDLVIMSGERVKALEGVAEAAQLVSVLSTAEGERFHQALARLDAAECGA